MSISPDASRSEVVGDDERLRMRSPPHGIPIMRQRWQRLAFLHWPVEPRLLGPLVPACLELDTWDGAAWVGLVPFTIEGTRPPFLPPLPGFSSFHELNFRTYVHRHGRNPGVSFFSLDATSRAAVKLARLAYKLPYHHARIVMSPDGDGGVSFSSRRDDATQAGFVARYAPAGAPEPARPGSLPFFLIERYLLYSWDGRRLRSARVWHRPYPVQPAHLADLEEDFTTRARLSVEAREALVHYAEEVDVRIYPPRLVAEGQRHWSPMVAQLAF